jgi:hypothetical protein
MEQRRNERHDVNSVLAIQNVMNNDNLGMLVNISSDGFMMIGPASVSEGNIYQLSLTLSESIDDSNKIDFAAECLWTNTADSEDKLWSGHRIIDVSDDDQKRINALIEQLG